MFLVGVKGTRSNLDGSSRRSVGEDGESSPGRKTLRQSSRLEGLAGIVGFVFLSFDWKG